MQLIREKYIAPEVFPLDIRLEGAIQALEEAGEITLMTIDSY